MTSAKRPNILIILADDLGFSDVGCFGSEIQTPNIDRLAAEGVRLTDFHAASACSPTRSMLLSGTDHHIAGLGTMAERKKEVHEGRPGYEGYLNDSVVSMQECLRDGGYETLMAGKWHLGRTPDRVPAARGFERSFAFLNGGHNHYGWEPAYEDPKTIPRIAKVLERMYYRDNEPVSPDHLPKTFYSTDYFSDTLLEFLNDRAVRNETRPFFAYLPFTAPHWPLQAPEASIRKYSGVYDAGPEALRQRRLAQLKKLGLVPQDAVAAPVISRDEDGNDVTRWTDMAAEEQRESSRKMEVYAGMVDRIDENVGRIIDYLEQTGQLDNTAVMFLSDNGAEGAQFEAWPLLYDKLDQHVEQYYDNRIDNLGAYNSFAWYGAEWASASTAPGLLFKLFTSEGGIRVPFVLRYPPLVPIENATQPIHAKRPIPPAGSIESSFCTVMDLMPTILDLCGVSHPGTEYQGREIVPMTGKSWLAYLRGDEPAIHDEDHVTGWELFGRRAIRQGSWKALYIPWPYGPNKWQLFDILKDPGETDDLSQTNPDKLQHMIDLYGQYCSRNGVVTEGSPSAPQRQQAVRRL